MSEPVNVWFIGQSMTKCQFSLTVAADGKKGRGHGMSGGTVGISDVQKDTTLEIYVDSLKTFEERVDNFFVVTIPMGDGSVGKILHKPEIIVFFGQGGEVLAYLLMVDEKELAKPVGEAQGEFKWD